ncbi:MAG: lipid-binding SYLF domain-containing protein [Acidobacteria bacterium]|nr:lipid-binding SYLF domain-containing protein [Acidobacteriota bacterium]
MGNFYQGFKTLIGDVRHRLLVTRKLAITATILMVSVGLQVAANTKDEAERASNAANVLTDILNAPDNGIPKELLDRAHAVAVIPHVIKGAFGVGGRFGKGLIAKRLSDLEWATPAFINIGGASMGFQIGVTATDLVLVFTDEISLKQLFGDRLKLGADASVTAGPIGRSAEAGVSGSLKSAIYAYSRSKGLFAGIALDGAVLTIDDDANHAVYGKGVTGKDILDNRVHISPVVKPFVAALNRYAPRRTA